MCLRDITPRHLWIACALGIAALLLRVVFVFAYPVSSLAGADPVAYWSFAQGIASGQGFRSTFEPWLADRPPLYSIFLAINFILFGESHVQVFIAQSILGAVATAVFYICAVRVMRAGRGFIAGLFFALFPHFLLFTKQILTESLYIPVLIRVFPTWREIGLDKM